MILIFNNPGQNLPGILTVVFNPVTVLTFSPDQEVLIGRANGLLSVLRDGLRAQGVQGRKEATQIVEIQKVVRNMTSE